MEPFLWSPPPKYAHITPLNMEWNYFFLGLSREEFEAFTTGLAITPNGTLDYFAQETAAKDDNGSCHIRYQGLYSFPSEFNYALFEICLDPPSMRFLIMTTTPSFTSIPTKQPYTPPCIISRPPSHLWSDRTAILGISQDMSAPSDIGNC